MRTPGGSLHRNRGYTRRAGKALPGRLGPSSAMLHQHVVSGDNGSQADQSAARNVKSPDCISLEGRQRRLVKSTLNRCTVCSQNGTGEKEMGGEGRREVGRVRPFKPRIDDAMSATCYLPCFQLSTLQP